MRAGDGLAAGPRSLLPAPRARPYLSSGAANGAAGAGALRGAAGGSRCGVGRPRGSPGTARLGPAPGRGGGLGVVFARTPRHASAPLPRWDSRRRPSDGTGVPRWVPSLPLSGRSERQGAGRSRHDGGGRDRSFPSTAACPVTPGALL